jgi:hypothetical protein
MTFRLLSGIGLLSTCICNKMFTSGVYPDRLKIAKIIPVFKTGDPMITSNYRPISILPAINKVFEAVLYDRLIKFIERNDFLYCNQFGFRRHKSTSHGLINLTNKILLDIDSSRVNLGVFIDLTKAFDTVDHAILVNKLNYYGIRGTSCELIKNYLQNREQYVTLDTINSSTRNIGIGVPQGSTLGPLLFLIYINDLHNCLQNGHVTQFADDTVLTFSHKNLRELELETNHDLKRLSKWLIANKLTLNAKKTNDIIFGSVQKISTLNCSMKISIQDQALKQVEYIKYLGVLVENT